MNRPLLTPYTHYLETGSTLRWMGRINQVVGNLIESDGPFCSVGESCEIVGAGGRSYAGEIIGFRGSTMLSMAADHPQGIRFGDQIKTWGARPSVRVGPELLGRVIDPTGNALDGKGAYRATHSVTIDGSAPLPLDRVPTRDPLGCGIRAIDAFVTCGRGQRVGIFGGSGVGKSTLIGMMARGTAADMTVLALVGERGREVNEFLEILGEEGLRRAVVLVSTSDQSPLLRIRAALAATAVAEYFASLGKNVLLIVDSLTRFAMAQREIGLAAGEPPTAKGYTPSVLNMLAAAGGAGRELFAGQHHCLLYRTDGGRRSAGSGGGYGPLASGWPCGSGQKSCHAQPLSADLDSGESQPIDVERGAGAASCKGECLAPVDGDVCPVGGPDPHRRVSERQRSRPG